MKTLNLSTEKNRPEKETVRALVLFSGGLDSILAVKILANLGIETAALTFVSYFFDANQAKKSAKENKIKLKFFDFSGEHLKVIKNPCYGRGAGMNPCIDCHLLMLKCAKIIAKKENFDIIATGEVLGQRPMSQNFRALELIEKKAGLTGKILRPLSAKVLPETEMEKSGKIDREKLLAISGRGRKEQMELAKKFGVKNYPSPAGGCILTEKEYSKKLGDLLEKINKPRPSDLQLLRIGRHFWEGKTKIILGRNREENLALKKMAETGDILIDPKNFLGPTALIRRRKREASVEASIEASKEKIIEYSKKSREKNPTFNIFNK